MRLKSPERPANPTISVSVTVREVVRTFWPASTSSKTMPRWAGGKGIRSLLQWWWGSVGKRSAGEHVGQAEAVTGQHSIIRQAIGAKFRLEQTILHAGDNLGGWRIRGNHMLHSR